MIFDFPKSKISKQVDTKFLIFIPVYFFFLPYIASILSGFCVFLLVKVVFRRTAVSGNPPYTVPLTSQANVFQFTSLLHKFA
ncbi:MAG: hypothetical protein A3H98_07960 [Bacteroidetes bacterium RIFCSPLOWO2_02_FULL_36_8]|nr:MAG: hypothetical protein A3H98_07960 [Bacteroidetes bacterium RIFCSPLOWO2_02_FULL_36_8]OFY71744.1 MAG: hypothetical protein A3G23_13570 [Bacteroidetes bacterium RIFCSPLOWO2_12_FULL_37_12]